MTKSKPGDKFVYIPCIDRMGPARLLLKDTAYCQKWLMAKRGSDRKRKLNMTKEQKEREKHVKELRLERLRENQRILENCDIDNTSIVCCKA